MDKEEMLKMAREAGCPTWFGVAPVEFVENFVNAILERAAVECDMAALFVDCDKEADGAMLCGTNIRALKTQGE